MVIAIIRLYKTNLKQKIYHVTLKVIMAFIMVVKYRVSKTVQLTTIGTQNHGSIIKQRQHFVLGIKFLLTRHRVFVQFEINKQECLKKSRRLILQLLPKNQCLIIKRHKGAEIKRHYNLSSYLSIFEISLIVENTRGTAEISCPSLSIIKQAIRFHE